MRKFGGYKSYHHNLDIKPVPEQVNFINEPWIADITLHTPHKESSTKDL